MLYNDAKQWVEGKVTIAVKVDFVNCVFQPQCYGNWQISSKDHKFLFVLQVSSKPLKIWMWLFDRQDLDPGVNP